MGVKRKIRRKGKVIDLNRDRYLLFARGIGALAEYRNVPLDELFLQLLEMTMGGFIFPLPVEDVEDSFRVQFLVAKNMDDVRDFRKFNREWEMAADEYTSEGFDNLRAVFPDIPERE